MSKEKREREREGRVDDLFRAEEGNERYLYYF
jgi:hypothetical protein